MESLKSKVWKIKSTSLYVITEFGRRYSHITVPILGKMLKDNSSFNKQTIAESLIILGEDGERILLKILNDNLEFDTKLKVSILKALSVIDIKSPSIDFVVETLYKSTQ